MSAEASGIIARQLSEQGQRLKAETAVLNLASTLRDDSVELLRKEGHTHTFRATMVMGLAVLPVTLLNRLSVLAEIYPKKVARRYLQYDQATYITRFLKEGDAQEPIMLFADDGDADRASSIQLGAWNTTEYLHIDTRSGRAEPLILCTGKDPRFVDIPVTDTSSGTRFDGSRARILRVASESDMQDYEKLLASLKELGPETEPVGRALPLLRPPLGYLPLSPIRRTY